ncbi:Probable ADP-ribosylation factor GTPase-activating protein [Seminavis robusta]|uniref:Probable ADP-ribosylation factor GTPase-activating protein n=1 Tax=Seminavis robusta TaxID=568900 RepID=A0A9N8H222_9STRA|nr:Probable ADP-ribosylation factor GTPase-activating protein [Seminavis robusta]|eukprot:Sro3_g002150.1 Probable ADP-ribosylation factor GTPase-activating protein (1063) ;mRNA; f:67801-71363
MDRREELQARKQRLQAVALLPANRVCSECPEQEPTWASLLKPPVANGKAIGVLCCYRCYSFHFQLGKTICQVKNIKMVEEWTNEEVEAMERGGGNQVVNAMYEAKLQPADYDKSEVLEDEDEDDMYRQEFVQHKYEELRYFAKHLYETQLRRASSSTNALQASVHDGPVPPAGKALARRCKSFDDNQQDVVAAEAELDRSKDFVKKPMRRRSQSFNDERWTTDEEHESTDDDQKLSYQMPGHLGVAGKRQKRRKSMPLKIGGNSSNTANDSGNSSKNRNRSSVKERRQRRASIKSSLEREAQQRRASQTGNNNSPSNEDLGYGDEQQNDRQNDMDATRRRCNRRRRDSNMSHNDGSGRRRSGRRKSASSIIMGTASISVDARKNACPSTAPRMPTRCVSDDSGTDGDDNNNNNDGDFTDYDDTPVNDRSLSPPKSNTPSSSRRMRRMSMPHSMFSSDTDDTEDEETMASHYKMHMLKTTRLSDPTIKKLSPFGVNLGYGYNDCHDSISSIEAEPQQHALKPMYMIPRRGSTGDGKQPVKLAALPQPSQQQPSKLLDPLQGGSELSSDEIMFGDAEPRKEKRRGKKNRRQMRRCSTGGAVDKFFLDAGQADGLSRCHADEDREANLRNWSPPEIPKPALNNALKKHRTPRRCSVGAESGPIDNKEQHPSTNTNISKNMSPDQSTTTNPAKNKTQQASIETSNASKGKEHHSSLVDPAKSRSRKTSKSNKQPTTEELGYGDDTGNRAALHAGPSEEDLGYGDLDYKADASSKRKFGVASLKAKESPLGYESCRKDELPIPLQHAVGRRGSSTGHHDADASHGRASRRLSRQGGSDERSRSMSRSRTRRPSASTPHESLRRPSLRDHRSQSVGGGLSFPSNPTRSTHVSSRRPSLRDHRSQSVGGGLSISNPPRTSGGFSMLDSGRTMVRSDSVSSLCSEVSVNAALLYAGGSKYNSCVCKKPDFVGSKSPVSVAVIAATASSGADCSLRDQEKGPENDDKDCHCETADAEGAIEEAKPSSATKRQSKKDYWKAKLAEKSKPKKDAEGLSSRERRRRVPSVGLAA